MNTHETKELALLKEKPFLASDRMIASHLREEWGESNVWILIAAALANLSAREGHAYLDLGQARFSGLTLPVNWPSLDTWKTMLGESSIARMEAEEANTPLVLCSESALYLDKYYCFEQRLAELIRTRCLTGSASRSGDAVQRAIESRFFVITGGPGTGKTTLALRYLDSLLDAWSESRPARFAAIAPTGKAAARLTESISSGVQRMDVSDDRKAELLAIPCLTIHRLLGTLPNRSSFRKDAKHPLRFDTLVIDESSMIDLPLMLRLFEALPEDCQVLLLGDKDQLSSVEVGSVLHDILQATENKCSPLAGYVERLSKTYRFSEESGIYTACQLAKAGDISGFEAFVGGQGNGFRFEKALPDAKRLSRRLLSAALRRHARLVESSDAEEALGRLGESIVLSPTRQGPHGTLEFNRLVLMELRKQPEVIQLNDTLVHGTPIIVLENNYEQELFNGDVGLAWLDSKTGKPAVLFQLPDGNSRSFQLTELPRHEPAFALTIHKSQGSEFDTVACVFSSDQERSLTRELLYTAFSRAKAELIVHGDLDTLLAGVGRQAVRATRLAELLSD